MKKLTTEQQIEVLELAKEIYIKEYVPYCICRVGMCKCIQDAVYRLFCEYVDYPGIRLMIPGFKKTKLREASKRGLIPKASVTEAHYWDLRDLTIRPKVFDYLISELKKENLNVKELITAKYKQNKRIKQAK